MIRKTTMRSRAQARFGMVVALAVVGGTMPALARPVAQPLSGPCGAVSFPAWSNDVGDPGMNAHVWSLEGVDDTSSLGPALYACGDFDTAGGAAAHYIAKWDGTAWSPLVGPLGEGLDDECEDIRLGPDDRLYVTGVFRTAGGRTANRIAAWDGVDFSPVGVGLDNLAIGMEFHDHGFGTELWLGGYFANPSGVAGNTLGRLTSWDGTFFSAYGTPGSYGANSPVWELREWDDGTGKTLYVAGQFTSITGTAANRIAKLSGATFAPLGSGLTKNAGTTPVQALMPYDDGTGEQLYAAGGIDDAGGVAVHNIARWNGTQWSDVAGGLVGGLVEGLTVADVGDGPKLYAMGYFSSAGTGAGAVPVSAIASWDGAWHDLLGGLDRNLLDHGMFGEPWERDGRTCLYVGGRFDTAGTLTAHNMARWCCESRLLGHAFDYQVLTRPVPVGVIDDGDGLPELLHCNGEDVPLHPDTSLVACGVRVVVGTAGDDTIDLHQADRAALVFAGPGDDTVVGTRFDDTVLLGAGDDRLDAGPGDDVALGGPGRDVLGGGPGADRLDGGEGDDVVAGGDGDDLLLGDTGTDLVDGGAGDDQVGGAEQVTQDADQVRCLRLVAQRGAGVARTRSDLDLSCVSTTARDPAADVDACLAGDPRGRLGRAAGAVAAAFDAACAVAPDVGFTTVPAVVAAGQDGGRTVLTELLGADPSSAVVSRAVDPLGARCQATALKAGAAIVQAQLTAFTRCTTARLAGAPVAVPPALGGCLDDVAQQAAAKVAKLAASAVRACGADAATLLPGRCASAGDLGACIRARMSCRACRTVNGMHGLALDCDAFDDARVNGSCPA